MKRPFLLLSLFIPTLLATTLFAHLTAKPTAATLPHGGFVVRVYYDTIADIDRLAGYDVWEYNNLHRQYVLVAVDQRGYDQLLDDGWRVAIDQPATAQLTAPAAGTTFFAGYRTVDELYADLDALNAAYPSLTERVTYGDSYCRQQGGCTTPGGQSHPGFPLRALRISNEAISGTSTVSGSTVVSGTKPVFFLMAGIHAREITTPELAMRMAEWLLHGYGTNADATWLVDWHEIWIVPTTNPDGHWLVEAGETALGGSPLFHRKNANGSAGCTTWPSLSYNHYGIDLNRNHSFGWGGAGTSTFPCNPTYRGTGAASEPETAALQSLVQSLIPDQRGSAPDAAAPADTTGIFITMHSYSELVLWPWGYTAAHAPNRSGLKTIGDKLATYNGYTSCQPTACLYAASGTSDDWAYGELGIPAFTFEVGTQFMPPYDEIDAVQWPENGPALQYAAKIARAPYRLVQGPDVISATTAVSLDTITLTVTLNDGNNGNQPVSAAALTVDAPYWAGSAVTTTLTPTDGAFDSPQETATAVLDAAALGNGRHTLYLRGQDADGNWGPVTAIFATGLLTDTNAVYLPLVERP